MGRTKVRTIVFLILIILTVTFLSLGVNLWRTCNENLDKYESVFTTIGVVDQKENAIKVRESWNAATKEYTYWDEPVYDTILPISLLDFEGANYIMKPEQRPYYGAYCPNIKVVPPNRDEAVWLARWGSIIEISPYDDCIPTEPVKVKVVKVLWGTSCIVGDDIWLCDHFNDNPGLLEKGKTYVTSIQSWPNQHSNPNPEAIYESCPQNLTISTQKNKNGELIGENILHENWAEVIDNFYNTREGEKWENLVEANDRFIKHTFPVIPTNKTELLMAFYHGKAHICEGRDITEEEYEKGEKVCIIPQNFAKENKFKIGDKLNIQMYFADYERSASKTYIPGGGLVLNFGLLNAEGEVYPVFDKGDYEIVGLYYNTVKEVTEPTGYEMGYNAVVIPMKSVKNSDKDNIVGYGPMKGYNTSFQIPNGTTKEYLEKFKALGINNLEVEFYDGGYEKLSSGMRNLKTVAIILVVVSIATTLAVLFFIIFMLISKQKKRTAIERSLGMSKKECTLSMIYGIILIVSIGAILGSFAGIKITGTIMSNSIDKETELYSTEFSNWVNNSDKMAEISETNVSANPLTSIFLCIAVIIVSFVLSLIFIKNNLNAEPLELFSRTEE